MICSQANEDSLEAGNGGHENTRIVERRTGHRRGNGRKKEGKRRLTLFTFIKVTPKLV